MPAPDDGCGARLVLRKTTRSPLFRVAYWYKSARLRPCGWGCCSETVVVDKGTAYQRLYIKIHVYWGQHWVASPHHCAALPFLTYL